jgi:hypothetical protein
MIIGTVLSAVKGDIYVVDNQVLSYNLHSVFCLSVLPVYSFLYGIISYAIYKKILHSQILLLITLVLSFSFAELFVLDTNSMIFGVFFFTPVYMVLSFLGIAVIALPLKLIAEYKKNN